MVDFDIFAPDKILINEPLKNHTTFKIGGACDIIFLPSDVLDIKACINICKRNSIRFFIMGNGSNLLVRDEGYRGVIIKLGKNISSIYQREDGLDYAQAGASLKSLSKYFIEKSLSGFEFADGIPGTVGGGVIMNAGAYYGEMAMVVHQVDILDKNTGDIRTLNNDDMQFGYRYSRIKTSGDIVLGASFKLKKTLDKNTIVQKITELNNMRKDKQPLNMPSAGSTFKRPIGLYAGKLISDAGLKGYRIGDACVSDKHAGFVVNMGNATAAEVILLIEHIKTTVKQKYDVLLEEEVVII